MIETFMYTIVIFHYPLGVFNITGYIRSASSEIAFNLPIPNSLAML